MFKKFLLIMSVIVLAACTNTKTRINNQSAQATQYNYEIVDETNRNDQQAMEITDYFKNALDRQLKKRIKSDKAVDTQIKYNIVYDKGNRALRYFVGFGAGKAKADIKVTVVSIKSAVTSGKRKAATAEGKVLATLTTEATLSIGFFGGDAKQILDNAAKDIVAEIMLADIFVR